MYRSSMTCAGRPVRVAGHGAAGDFSAPAAPLNRAARSYYSLCAVIMTGSDGMGMVAPSFGGVSRPALIGRSQSIETSVQRYYHTDILSPIHGSPG